MGTHPMYLAKLADWSTAPWLSPILQFTVAGIELSSIPDMHFYASTYAETVQNVFWIHPNSALLALDVFTCSTASTPALSSDPACTLSNSLSAANFDVTFTGTAVESDAGEHDITFNLYVNS